MASLSEADTDAIRKQIETAEDTNRKVRENATRKKTEEEVSRLREKSKELTEAMEAIREKQHKALEEAQWPIDGLGIDEDGVLYQGLPFEQASKSVRVLTSVKIGMALNPKLRVLVCQDGNDLDGDAMKALEDMLVANDFQMIVEMVTRGPEDESRCAVVVENGRKK